jgi:hypothetical protein
MKMKFPTSNEICFKKIKTLNQIVISCKKLNKVILCTICKQIGFKIGKQIDPHETINLFLVKIQILKTFSSSKCKAIKTYIFSLNIVLLMLCSTFSKLLLLQVEL